MTNRRKRYGRDVDGILLLDKPIGISSNLALQKVKGIYQAKKAGHTGNLDVLATGVLPVCLGDATKVSAYLLDADKRYQTTGTLGQMTSTGDLEGEVVNTLPVPDISEQQLREILAGMQGRIEQVPPMFSALKHQGQPLYKLARKGVEIERKVRSVEIFAIDLLEFDGQQMTLDVKCSKGTYIRTLIEDIGSALGTCAHVSALRRTAAGEFTIEDCLTLDAVRELAGQGTAALDARLLPVDSALQHLPQVNLTGDQAELIIQGQAVEIPVCPDAALHRLYESCGRFLGIGRLKSDGRLTARRLMRQSNRQSRAESQISS